MTETVRNPEDQPLFTIEGPFALTDEKRNLVAKFLQDQYRLLEDISAPDPKLPYTQEEYQKIEYLLQVIFLKKGARLGGENDTVLHLAVSGQEVVGFELVRTLKTKDNHAITHPLLCVAWEEQGRGIGTALLQARINNLKSQGKKSFTTQTLDLSVIHIYQKLRAKVIIPENDDYGLTIDISQC